MIRIKHIPKKDMPAFTDIVAVAYPGMDVDTKEKRRDVARRLIAVEQASRDLSTYGLYRDGKLLGGLRLFDFRMNVFGVKTLCGGGGLLAVDLPHKKEKVARDLMEFFIEHFRQKKAPLAALYPFRPDFYRKMGFGYGTKTCQYIFRPGELPLGGDRQHVRFLTKRDRPAMMRCHDRFAQQIHGMTYKCRFELMRLDRPGVNAVGFVKNRQLQGYLVFTFKHTNQSNFIFQSLHIQEFVYESREALSGLLAFLQSQADQVHHIVYGVQDDGLHFLPSDPRTGSDNLLEPLAHETNSQGVGIMYKVIDVAGFFRLLKSHRFGREDCRLKITVQDSFTPGNDGSYVIHFVGGRPHVKRRDADHEVEITLDIAEFSSLVLGVVDFARLHRYGLAEISDADYLDVVNRLFLAESRPITLAQF